MFNTGVHNRSKHEPWEMRKALISIFSKRFSILSKSDINKFIGAQATKEINKIRKEGITRPRSRVRQRWHDHLEFIFNVINKPVVIYHKFHGHINAMDITIPRLPNVEPDKDKNESRINA